MGVHVVLAQLPPADAPTRPDRPCPGAAAHAAHVPSLEGAGATYTPVMSELAEAPVRRPLRSRGKPWAWALARRLTAWRVSPNLISSMSIVFAAAAGLALALAPRVDGPLPAAGLYLAAAAGMQLRLLANLMDGMVAVEGGLGSKTGELWNDLPDRFADGLVFVGAAYGLPPLPFGVALDRKSVV